MKKALVTAGIVTAVGIAGVSGLGVASASTDNGNGNGPMSGLVEAIATKFNLNKDEVQAVVSEQHDAMEAEREQEVKDEVTQLVTDGKLTQAQADAINAKRSELEAQREAERTSGEAKTAEERKTQMDAHRAELDKWLSDNGISDEYHYLLMGGRGHGNGGGGPRGGEFRSGIRQSDSGSTVE